jgi:hypothetical protein
MFSPTTTSSSPTTTRFTLDFFRAPDDTAKDRWYLSVWFTTVWVAGALRLRRVNRTGDLQMLQGGYLIGGDVEGVIFKCHMSGEGV